MPRTKIQEILTNLHQELVDHPTIAAADQDSLREVLHEIEGALSGNEIHDSLGDRVKQSVATFEATHPTIASGLHGLVESLAKL